MSDKKPNTKLKKAIKEAGFSYESFAKEIDVTKQTIQNACNGVDIHKHTKIVIAITLSKSVTELFN